MRKEWCAAQLPCRMRTLTSTSLSERAHFYNLRLELRKNTFLRKSGSELVEPRARRSLCTACVGQAHARVRE